MSCHCALITGCMNMIFAKDRIAKLALKFRLRSFAKLNASPTMVIRAVSHEQSVYILITKARRLNSRLNPCSFVAALNTLQVLHKDPGLRGW